MRPQLKNKKVKKENGQRPIPLTLDDIARVARGVAMEHGGHVAMIAVEGSRRSVIGQLPEFSQTHEGRARQMFGAGFTLGKRGEIGALRQVFFVSEAWMSTASGGKLPSVAPSQDPNRKEVLIIASLKLAGQQTRMVILEMVRDAKGQLIELRDFQRTEGGASGKPASERLCAGVSCRRQGELKRVLAAVTHRDSCVSSHPPPIAHFSFG